ncbi:MAG TPA: SDR family oxidoreductase [Acidimicrobiales bacterium]|jgi:NAD(P)-dependent dehydrogenase (short-subunit alcohol dehydrogenase family)
MLLDGKVAIVSGIGPGMGRDISLAFAREGAHVVLGGRTKSRLEAVAKEVEAAGVKALPVVCDITDEASCQALAAQAAAELGGVDIVVNNAYDGGDAKSLMDADLARWHQTMEVNLFGALYLTRAAVPHLEASGDGRVIMINSMSTQRIQSKFGAYNASKSALAGITKTLALELGPKGIRVNAVHPGYIYGDSIEWYFNHQAEKRGITFQEVYDEVASETCLGYLPHSEEIAGTVVFFASPLAKPVTGQMIGVNGGHWFNG